MFRRGVPAKTGQGMGGVYKFRIGAFSGFQFSSSASAPLSRQDLE